MIKQKVTSSGGPEQAKIGQQYYCPHGRGIIYIVRDIKRGEVIMDSPKEQGHRIMLEDFTANYIPV
jgi:hypothetical protein